MVKLNIAMDNGNSEQDMVFNDVPVTNPNVYARVQKLPNLDEVSAEYVLQHIHDNLIAVVEGQLYYVGAYAMQSNQHCRSIQVGVDNDKVSSSIVYVNTLAHAAAEALAEACRSHDKGTKHDLAEGIVKAEADMTTAIPVSYYTAKAAHTLEEKFIGKQHTVQIYAGAMSYTVKLSFGFVKVIPEGVTAAHAFLADPERYFGKGAVADAVKDARILHVAIGEGTTEFPITTGIAFNPNFITGTDNGNGHAIKRVLEPFKRDFGLRDITRQDFSRYIRSDAHKYHEAAMDYLMPALEDEASDILTKAEQVIAEANNEIDVVAVYGGGSILMKEFLKPRLAAYCERARIKLIYIDDPAEAVFLEAEGLNAFLNSNLFQLLKKRAA